MSNSTFGLGEAGCSPGMQRTTPYQKSRARYFTDPRKLKLEDHFRVLDHKVKLLNSRDDKFRKETLGGALVDAAAYIEKSKLPLTLEVTETNKINYAFV